MRVVCLLIALGLSACHKAPPPAEIDRSIAGNGGDVIGVRFEQGRQQVLSVVEGLTPKMLESLKSLDPKDAAWLLDNRTALLDDLRKSPHHWNDGDLPSGCTCHTCGCTAPGVSGAAVTFARARCEASVKNKIEAGQVLLHETLHHLRGPKEETANRLAGAIYDAWTAAGHGEVPHWTSFPQVFPAEARNVVWNGQELITRLPDKLVYHNPRTGEAHHRSMSGGPDSLAPSHLYRVGERLVAYAGCPPNSSEPTTFVAEPGKREWEPISSAKGPRASGWLSEYAGSSAIFFWGPIDCGEIPSLQGSGAVLDLAQRRWIPISMPPGFDELSFPRVVGVDDVVYLIDDFVDGKGTYHRFDLRARSWGKRPLPAELVGRNVSTLSDGKRILLLNRSGKKLGLYTPSQDHWQLFTVPDALAEGDLRFLAWAGGQLVVMWNESVAIFTPENDHWELHPQQFAPAFGQPVRSFWLGPELLIWIGNKPYSFFP